MTWLKSAQIPATTLALAISASSLQAAAYSGTAYEGFNYTAGDLTVQAPPANSVGLNGGSGWTQPWGVTLGGDTTTVVGTRYALGNTTITTSQQIVGGGLTYTDLATSGGAVQVTGPASGNSASVGRAFGQTVDSGVFYFSYLFQKTSDTVRTTNVAFFGSGGATAQPNERVSIGQFANSTTYLNASGNNYNAGPSTPTVPTGTDQGNKGDLQVGLFNSLPTGSIYNSTTGKGNGIFERNASTNPFSVPTQSITLNQTFYIVGKFEFDISGADDRLTLYLNPSVSASEGSLTPYFTVTGVDFGSLTGFRVFAGNASSGTLNGSVPFSYAAAAAIYDEFRFGTNFSDVVVAVPEPGTVGVAMGLGLGLLVALRRRRKA